jgi:hypothetical protein
MAPQSNSDDSISATSTIETRRFTGTIPYDILLNIIERCDVPTLMMCRRLNKSTRQLILLFSHQLVDKVASREIYYKQPLFKHHRPARLTLSYLSNVHLAHMFCMKMCVKRYGGVAVSEALAQAVDARQDKTIRWFLDMVELGCLVAINLVNARRAGEKLFAQEQRGHMRKTFNRELTAHCRLERHIEKAQLDVLNKFSPTALLSFKLFWLCRAVAITPRGRFTAPQASHHCPLHRQNRSVQRKEVQDPQEKTWNMSTKHWAAGFLLDFGTPVALFDSFRVEVEPMEVSWKAFEKLSIPMAERRSKMSYGARVAHLERAQRILDEAEFRLARAMAASLHNYRLLNHVMQYLRELRASGQYTQPFMSASPFVETIESMTT